MVDDLDKGSTSHEHPDSAYHMPGTELRSPAHRHGSAGAHLTHLLDHESPPDPRRLPESSRPVAGEFSSASKERASRLPADTSRSRAAVRRLAAGLLLVVAGLLGVSTAAAQTSITQTGGGATWTLTGHTSVAAGGKYTFTITLESGTKPFGEYAGFYLTDTADNQDKLGTAPNNCTSPKQFCISFSGRPPNGIFDNLGGHDTRWALLSSTSPHTLTATFAVAADAPDGSTIEFGALDTDGVPRGDGLTITTTTLVSNTGQNNSNAARVESLELAQAFGTGSHTAGYDLASIVLSLGAAPTGTATLTVTVREDASGDPSGTALYTLTTPDPIAADALNIFTAPAGATLDANTTYWVVASYSANIGGVNWWRTLLSNGIDSGGAAGWTIDSPFKSDSRTAPDGWEVVSSSRALKLQVKGTEKGGTTLSSDATLSALALSGVALDDPFAPATEDYTATVVNSVMETTVTATTTHSGATVALKYGDDTPLTNPVTLDVGDNVIKAVVTAEDLTAMKTYMVTVTREGTTDTPVTIEAEHGSIGAGLEDLVFTLTREGETTDALDVTVTIVQDESWLGDSDLSHDDVTFEAGSATAELTITASKFSFTPSTTGDLSATVSGDGIDGGSDTVEIISTSEPPITISYDMSDYTFAENSTDAAVYLVATLDAAYPREPSRNYFMTFSTRSGTAKADNDYAPISERESFTRSEYGRDADTDPFVARKLLSDFGFAIVDDAIYEGSERLGLIMEGDHPPVVGMAAFQKPDGTTCEPFVDCPNPPFEYPVTITDEGDLPALLLSAVPASIAEEDDDGTTSVAENVSTVTVEITNGKTFAVDQTVTLTFSGTATQGTHYSVNPGDADPNTAGHQVVLVKETASVEVTVTATGNDTADRNRTVTVAADLDGTAIGSTDITILDDETTNTDATGQPLITGTARVGGELTATKNTIADTDGLPVQFPDDYTFEWVRVDATDTETPIGTDSNNYMVLSADVGSTIRVDVSFTDGAGYSEGPLASVETAVVVANTAPTVDTPIPDQSATVGTAFSYTFPTTTFSDADNDPLTYMATKADDTPLPAWLSFVAGTRTFSGTPPATVEIPLSLKVTASDGYGGSVSDMFDINAIRVPYAPTGLTATASGTSTINLTWTGPSSDGGASITGYRIEVSPNGTSSWTDLEGDTDDTNTTYAHTGLSAGTTRHYRVSAINSVGTGAASNVDNATTTTTVPGAPTSLTATASGSTRIDLDWDAPSNDGGASITGYRIEVSPNGTSSWTDLEGDTDDTNTTYAHTGLSAGTTRHYRVSAINSVGTGAASSTANATTDDDATTVPGAPTSLTATASGSTRIDLDWDAPSNDGGASITGYRIEVSPNGTSSWTDLEGDTDDTNTTYAHTGLSAGTTRHYRVSAINSVGTGAASNVDNATTTTVPGAPTSLTATASGTTTINLSWTAPADGGGSAITGYRIEVSPNGTSSWTNRVATTGNTNTTYAHTGLSAGTTRHYRVSAINSVGTGAASNVDNATTTTVPGAPTSLTATASGTTTINLDWTAPSDNGGSAITGYRIEVSPNGTSNWTNRVANTGTTSTTYSHTGLSAGTTRHYRVSAINSVGTGTASSTDNATTDADAEPGLAVVTVHALATSVSGGGLARFELRRSGGDLGWLKVSYRHDESSDGNYVESWGYFKPGVTRKGADYDVGRSPGTVTARVTGPSDPLCTEDNDPSDSCTDNYMVGNPSSASMQVTASASSSDAAAAADDALEDALTLVDDLTPDVAAAVLLGEQTLGEAELAALDRLGNGNGRYDLGDLLSWIERCRRGEARCGPTSTGSGPPSAAGLLAAAAAGRPWRRTRRRGSGRPGRKSIRAARRRGRFAGYALATLLAVTMTLSCTEGSVGPAAYVPDPGFLTVEWTGPAAGRGIGVLLELEGPGIEAVRAPGFELYESRASGRHEIVVAGSLRAGPLVQFRVPDRGQLPLYRVRVLEVAGEDYELRDAGQYRAVITLH